MAESSDPLTDAEPHAKGVPVADLEPQEIRDGRVSRLLPEWMSPLGVPEPGLGRISVSASPNSALPALTVRRATKGIGRYLKESKVLVLQNESEREAAIKAVEAAGFDVLHPVNAHAAGEPLFNGEAKPIGAWGNVVGFYTEIRLRKITALVALVDLEARELFCISDELKPALLTRLARMGVTIDLAGPPSPIGNLNSKLAWFSNSWETSFEEHEPRYQVPTGGPLRMSRQLAAELPPEVVAAYEEQLRSSSFDPMPVRSKGGASWETTNGVLDEDDVAAYRELAPRGVTLPDDWEICWEMAMELSAPHAPSLCALYLHDFHPKWWDELPLTPHRRGGAWLMGHSMSNPYWLRQDHTLESERRLQCTVALIVSAVGDLRWLRKESREKVECAACGRSYEKGMLQAGEIYQRQTARVCMRCAGVPGRLDTGVGWPTDERDLTTVQREGIIATLRWYTKVAGGVISADMLDKVEFPEDLSEEACFVLERQLPGYVMTNWVEWLAQSGVLGESWRPSFGQVSVASDGHMCRSFLERVIDDFLSANGIAHETEPLYPYDETLNQHGLRADWGLEDGTFVEAAGMLTSPEYAAKIERKKSVARQHCIDLIILDEADLTALTEIFEGYLN